MILVHGPLSHVLGQNTMTVGACVEGVLFICGRQEAEERDIGNGQGKI
jgi:hypothetical protein